MLTCLLLSALAAPVAALPPLPPPAVVQDDELKEQIKAFDKILSSKEQEDEAIAMMDKFLLRFTAARNRRANLAEELEFGDGSNEKELKAEIKELDKEMDLLAETVHGAFTHKRRKDVTQANLKMWKTGAFCLGQMGDRGAEYLWEVFEDKKRFRKEPDFRGLCLAEIGSTGSMQYFDNLVDLLDHTEYLFIAKAAEALSRYEDVPGAKRKEAVDRCVKLFAEYYESHASDPSDVEAQERYRKTGPSMKSALEALTGVTQKGPMEWRTWFNKNKNDAELWSD